MALRANDAYAGDAEMPNGITATVYFMDKAAIAAEFGKQPPGHPHKRRVGWYWRTERDEARTIGGPFTSSRKAMMDALASNGGAR